MRRTALLPFLQLVTATAVVTGACVAAGGPDETTEGAGRPDPIGEYLGVGISFGLAMDDEQVAEAFETQKQNQEDVAVCMAEQGFDYTPVGPRSGLSTFASSKDDLDFLSREWTEKWGFEISTTAFSQQDVGPDLVGHLGRTAAESSEKDPNTEHYESLDLAERQAWDSALYGELEWFAPDSELDSPDAEDTGCYAHIFGPLVRKERILEEFGPELKDAYEAALADPRSVAAYELVNECLTGKGFDAIKPRSPFTPFVLEVNMILLSMGRSLEDSLFEPEEPLQPPDDEVKAELAQVQKDEVEFALASFDCGAPMATPPVVTEVLAEYEQRFVDNNAAALEPYRFKPEG